MKPIPTKPGAERRRFTPDRILRIPIEAQEPLMEMLLRRLPDQKRTGVKALLAYGQVMVNGQVTSQFDTPLQPGDLVEVNFSRPFVVFHNHRLKIVYEDDDIIVVNKGYGLLSMSTGRAGREETAYSILRDYVKAKDPRNKIFIVHRLDQHTSGLMMFAKTVEAKEAMQHNWNNMVLSRTYVAVVEGVPDPSEGTIRSHLAENAEHLVYSIDNPEKGQLAVTSYRTLGTRGRYSLVELQLATGRKNQIRVHMSEKGWPIVGDRRYGAKTGPIRRLALHARTLRFAHPITRRAMDFSTPIPAPFLRLAPAEK